MKSRILLDINPLKGIRIMSTKYNSVVTGLLDVLKELLKELELTNLYLVNRGLFFKVIRFIGETYALIYKLENMTQYKYNDYKLLNVEVMVIKDRLKNIIEEINNKAKSKSLDITGISINGKLLNGDKIDISVLLENCANVTELDNFTKYRTKRIPYDKLTDEEKQEVLELVKQSNNIPYFKLVLNLNELHNVSSTITAIKLVKENKIIGFYFPIKILKGKYKDLYRCPTIFINTNYRGIGYGKEILEKYFSNKKGVRWINDTDKKKQLLFSSLGFTKTEDQAVNYDDINLGTFWIKK